MKEKLNIEESFVSEIIGRLIAHYPHVLKAILDDINEDCYKKAKNFLEKIYTEIHPLNTRNPEWN